MSGSTAGVEETEDEADDDDNEVTMAQKLAKSKNKLRTVSHSPCFEFGELMGALYFMIYCVLVWFPCWCAGKVSSTPFPSSRAPQIVVAHTHHSPSLPLRALCVTCHPSDASVRARQEGG